MATVDYSDPCAALQAVRGAYYALLEGRAAYQVEFEVGSGTRRRVTYHQTDINAVRAEMTRLEAACSAAQGKAPVRAVKFKTHKGV